MAWLGSHCCKWILYSYTFLWFVSSLTPQRYFTSVFVSLGVFLFGYDQGVMSGIITFVSCPKRRFQGVLKLITRQWLVFQGLFQPTVTRRNWYGCCNPRGWSLYIFVTRWTYWRLDRAPPNDSLWLNSLFHRWGIADICKWTCHDDGRSYCRWFRSWRIVNDRTCLPVWDIGKSYVPSLANHC